MRDSDAIGLRDETTPFRAFPFFLNPNAAVAHLNSKMQFAAQFVMDFLGMRELSHAARFWLTRAFPISEQRFPNTQQFASYNHGVTKIQAA